MLPPVHHPREHSERLWSRRHRGACWRAAALCVPRAGPHAVQDRGRWRADPRGHAAHVPAHHVAGSRRCAAKRQACCGRDATALTAIGSPHILAWVSDNQLGAAAAARLAAVLPSCPTLTSLDLQCAAQPGVTRARYDHRLAPLTARSLWCTGNHVGSGGAASIAGALERTEGLTTLILASEHCPVMSRWGVEAAV